LKTNGANIQKRRWNLTGSYLILPTASQARGISTRMEISSGRYKKLKKKQPHSMPT